MALDFPNTPTDGQIYTDSVTGNRYKYVAAYNYWSFESSATSGAGVNTDAQYTWTNTQTFSANIIVGTNVTINATVMSINDFTRVTNTYISIGNSGISSYYSTLTNAGLKVNNSTSYININPTHIYSEFGNSSFETIAYGGAAGSAESSLTQYVNDGNYSTFWHYSLSNTSYVGTQYRYMDGLLGDTANAEIYANTSTGFLALRTNTTASSITANSSQLNIGNSSVNVYANSTAFVGNVVATRLSGNLTGNVTATSITGNLTGNVTATTITGNLTGNVAATTITGNLTGNVAATTISGNLTGNVTATSISGNLTGNVVATTVNATANVTVGANVLINTSAFVISNTTAITSRTASALTVGNTTITTAPQILVQNTAGTTTINSNFISTTSISGNLTGNTTGVHTGNVSATTISGNLTGNVVAITISGNLTGNVAATTITGNLTGNVAATTVSGNLTGNVVATTVNATANITLAANVLVNTSAFYIAGNTTTAPTMTLIGTGLTVGNTSITGAPQVVIANTSGTTTINSNFISTTSISGNLTGNVTATNISGNLTGNVVATTISGNLTGNVVATNISGNLTGNVVATTISGNLTGNVAASVITASANITLDNDKGLYFKTKNTAATVGFRQQNDDNFVFYSTDATYAQRAVFSIFANSSSSNLAFSVPVLFNTNVYLGSAPISANGRFGAAGEVLTSNGSAAYWTSAGAATVNTSAQYTWSNLHTFQANVSITANALGLTTNTSAIYLAGTADANWKIGRNTGSTTKWFYTGNTIDIIAATGTGEGFTVGFTGNTFFETGYAGTFVKDTLKVGNSTVNVSANATAFIGNVVATTISGNLTGNVVATTISGNLTGNVAATTISGNLTGNVSATTITSGAVVANTTGLYVNSATADLYINSASGIWANSSFGNALDVLTSNGSAVYWSPGGGAGVNVNAQYVWTNTQTFQNTITFSSAINVGSSVANTTGFYPASNTVGTALGNATARWVLTANTISATGDWTTTGNVGFGAAAQNYTRLYVQAAQIGDSGGYNQYAYYGDNNTAMTAARTKYGIASQISNFNQNKNAAGTPVYDSYYYATVGDAFSGSSSSSQNAYAYEMTGGKFTMYHYANGAGANTVVNARGSYSQVYLGGTAAGTITSAFGSISQVYVPDATRSGAVTSAYGVYSGITSNTGYTITDGYLFYGSHQGATTTNKYGLYLTGESNNYISGNTYFNSNVGFGTTADQVDSKVSIYSNFGVDASSWGYWGYLYQDNTSITAARSKYGAQVQVVTIAQNKSADGLTSYASNYRGMIGDVQNGNNSSTSDARANEMIGGMFRAYNYANGTTSNSVVSAKGSQNQVLSYGGAITTAYGTIAQILIGNTTTTGNISTAYGTYSEVQSNTLGQIGTGYLYYGQHTGANTTTKYGLYLTGEANNYISGNLQIGRAVYVQGNVAIGAGWGSIGDTQLDVGITWTSDLSLWNQYNGTTDSNVTTTAARTKYGFQSSLVNQNQNRDGVGTVYLATYRAIDGRAYNGSTSTGGDAFADELQAGSFRAYNYATGATSNTANNVRGVYAYAGQYGTGQIPYTFAVYAATGIGNTTVTGGIGNAYAVAARVESNTAATIANGFLFHGRFDTATGTVTNKYGVYVTGEANNYFSSNVTVAGTLTGNHSGNTTAVTVSASANVSVGGNVYINLSSVVITGSATVPTTVLDTDTLTIGNTSVTGAPQIVLANSAGNTTMNTTSVVVGSNAVHNLSAFSITGTATVPTATLVTTGLTVGNTTVTGAPQIILANSAGNTTVNTTSVVVGANAVHNLSAFSITGTATVPTATLITTGLTVGNTTVTGAPQVVIANSAGTTTINSNFISTTSISGNLTGNVVAVTISGNLTGNVVATTISGNLTGNVTATTGTFGSAITANATGLYVNSTTSDLYMNSASGIWANGTFGTNNQVMTSNGSAVYWTNPWVPFSVRQSFTGDGTTTSFTVTNGYSPSNIDVYLNGVKVINGTDVTVTSGTSVVFAVAPPNGAIIEIVANAANTVGIRAVTVSSTAPAAPALYDLWIDLNV